MQRAHRNYLMEYSRHGCCGILISRFDPTVQKPGCVFVEEEAVLSGSDMSSDEDCDSDDDKLEASFVNDDTQLTQPDIGMGNDNNKIGGTVDRVTNVV